MLIRNWESVDRSNNIINVYLSWNCLNTTRVFSSTW